MNEVRTNHQIRLIYLHQLGFFVKDLDVTFQNFYDIFSYLLLKPFLEIKLSCLTKESIKNIWILILSFRRVNLYLHFLQKAMLFNQLLYQYLTIYSFVFLRFQLNLWKRAIEILLFLSHFIQLKIILFFLIAI